MGAPRRVSDSIRTDCDDTVASPVLIAVSILGILSSRMYDSYGCMEDFFKALTCLLVHNIWRIHVYAPKPHLTFSGYDESLMMTSIGFHIFGPQINKVVTGVGQPLSRGVCQCVHVCMSERASEQSQPASDCKVLVLIGGQAWPSLRRDAPGLAELRPVFQVFFQAIPACEAVGVPSIIDQIQGWKQERSVGTEHLWPHTEKKKNESSFDRQLCVKRDKEMSFLISNSAWYLQSK